jgi:sulfide:quinone oxidoreductase
VARSEHPRSYGGLRVVIAGGGVAGLEALLALRALAGDLVDLEMLAPDPAFWYRPLAVGEPFGIARAHRLELAEVARRVSAGLTLAQLASVDTDAHVARTNHGGEIPYDALVIACGAMPRPWLPGALNFRGPADTEAFRRLLSEAESGDLHSIAFALPPGAWPLPVYELALLTATHLGERRRDVEITIVTPEPAPLCLFGDAATEAIRTLLTRRGIAVEHSGVPSSADRVVTMPTLEGIRILGIPQDEEGFIATDLSGRVHGLTDVYAAGDITQFPIKQRGIAAQQAEVVAEAIAARAGAGLQPHRFEPVLRGLLLTGGAPRYLRSGRGDPGTISGEPLWWPPTKIVGRYLGPFLAEHGGFELLQPPADTAGALEIAVELGPPCRRDEH